MSAVAISPSNGLVRKLNLSDRCPPGACDPGGFKGVLYNSIPAFEISAPVQSLTELDQAVRHVVEAENAQYVLLDLDAQNSLPETQFAIEELTSQFKAIGCLLIPHLTGRAISLGRSVFPDRETAIDECLRDWEAKLLPNFSW